MAHLRIPGYCVRVFAVNPSEQTMSTIDYTEHVSLVHYIIRRSGAYRLAKKSSCVDYEDLLQEGLLGLLKAVEKFNPDKHPDVKFNTYAGYWIQAYVTTYALEKMRTVRVPKNTATKAWKAGNPYPITAKSIDTGFLGDGDEETGSKSLLDVLGFATYQDDEKRDTDDLHRKLHNAINSLTARESAVLRGRYFEDQTLSALGEQWGITRERTRQIQAEALGKLRSYFQARAA